VTIPTTGRQAASAAFIEVHEIDGGVAVDDVAKAHLAGLRTQAAYDLRYLRYWAGRAGRAGVLPGRSTLREAAANVHREAHGLVANPKYRDQEGP
jgi:hypothetical protein